MKTVLLHFDKTLQFFSKAARIRLPLREKTAVKHLIEAAGVPHVEIGQITLNGQTADLMTPVQDAAVIHVRAAAAACPVQPPRFILDMHLGRLAAYLRMLGWDTIYHNQAEDAWLAETAAAEQRILITRDRRLLMRKIVRFGYCPRSLNPVEQLHEVVARFALKAHIQPFRRCLRCNAPLQPVEKAAILSRLQPLTRRYYDDFRLCPQCGQIYWRGSHFERMQDILQDLLS